jgi:hypothetical protein
MSTHKRITQISARVARELVISAIVARVAAASIAADARHVYGWVRFCSGL